MLGQKKNNKLTAEQKEIIRKRRFKPVLIIYLIVLIAVWIGGTFVYKWAANNYTQYIMGFITGADVPSFSEYVWRSTITYLLSVSFVVSLPFLYLLVSDGPGMNKAAREKELDPYNQLRFFRQYRRWKEENERGSSSN